MGTTDITMIGMLIFIIWNFTTFHTYWPFFIREYIYWNIIFL